MHPHQLPSHECTLTNYPPTPTLCRANFKKDEEYSKVQVSEPISFKHKSDRDLKVRACSLASTLPPHPFSPAPLLPALLPAPLPAVKFLPPHPPPRSSL